MSFPERIAVRSPNGSLDAHLDHSREARVAFPTDNLPSAVNAKADAKTSKLPVTIDSDWQPVQIDWKKTQLGPGYPDIIDSAWGELGVLSTGTVVRIEADGFNAKESKIAGWGWYINVWSGDARRWATKADAFRLLHLNPRPRAGIIAMNHFLKSGWGQEKDVPIPKAWQLENAASPFVLDLELGAQYWKLKLNKKEQTSMAYPRKGDFLKQLTLQLYDVINPRVSLNTKESRPIVPEVQ